MRAGAYLAAAAGMLLLPLWFVVSLIIAAAFHEFCHYLALKIAKIRVYRIAIGPFGASMETEAMGSGTELLCALAGPMGSLMLVPFFRLVPGIALCGLIQGTVNLLLIYPMDGGRILRCLLEVLKIPCRELVCDAVEWMTALGILALGLWLHRELGWGAVLVGAVLLLRIIRRKIPCIEGRFGVQ